MTETAWKHLERRVEALGHLGYAVSVGFKSIKKPKLGDWMFDTMVVHIENGEKWVECSFPRHKPVDEVREIFDHLLRVIEILDPVESGNGGTP